MSISSEIERIQSAKSDIITAIENKGVTVPTGATIDALPELIDSIPGGGGGGGGVIDKITPFGINEFSPKVNLLPTRIENDKFIVGSGLNSQAGIFPTIGIIDGTKINELEIIVKLNFKLNQGQGDSWFVTNSFSSVDNLTSDKVIELGCNSGGLLFRVNDTYAGSYPVNIINNDKKFKLVVNRQNVRIYVKDTNNNWSQIFLSESFPGVLDFKKNVLPGFGYKSNYSNILGGGSVIYLNETCIKVDGVILWGDDIEN